MQNHAALLKGALVAVVSRERGADLRERIDRDAEADADGGEVVSFGTPEQVAKNRISRTAPFLRKVLKAARGQTVRSS